ncbi:MAG: hypothetical protein AUK48_06365 [Oscillatoriales cyanobacterium CG2_30_44_21]|nr:MAG: hypothetical protein AUK48_06365 [Oscillatoriales cyanobacterium CG2_30_44_21]
MSNPETFLACNPSYTICLRTENYYVNLADGRGEDVIKRMRRMIALSPNRPTYQLLSGHTGKTTELLRLKAELEQQGFMVIHIAVAQYLQIEDISLCEIWLVLLKLILCQLEKQVEAIALKSLPDTITELEKCFKLSPPIGIPSYKIRLQNILQNLQDFSNQRFKLLNFFESRLKSSLFAAVEEVITLEVDRLKRSHKKGLVVLIDNLDQLLVSQADLIFGEGGKYLRQFPCHTVYTFPIVASDDLKAQLQDYSSTLYHLSNLVIRDRQGEINEVSLSLLCQLVLARLLSHLEPEQRLSQVTEAFDSLNTLHRLCLASYGHLTYLISLLYGCIQRQSLPIASTTVDQVLETARVTRIATIIDGDWLSLQLALTGQQLPLDQSANLMRRLLLFEYHDADGNWFVSPFSDIVLRGVNKPLMFYKNDPE